MDHRRVNGITFSTYPITQVDTQGLRSYAPRQQISQILSKILSNV